MRVAIEAYGDSVNEIWKALWHDNSTKCATANHMILHVVHDD